MMSALALGAEYRWAERRNEERAQEEALQRCDTAASVVSAREEAAALPTPSKWAGMKV